MGHGTLPSCKALECCPNFFSSVWVHSLDSKVVLMAAGLWEVQIDKNPKNRSLAKVESLQEHELERLLGLSVNDSSPLPVGRYLLGNGSV